MKRMTLTKLARAAGVGVATVDRVLNDRGGVSPAMTRKVLEAARAAGLNRILPEEHRQPWQIEVILSSTDAFFFQQLAQDFQQLADALGYRRLRLQRTFVAENAPEKLAAHILASSRRMDGLMLFAHEHPAIYQALSDCKARGVPVITLVSDLPDADRLLHVGINQLQAGRTAGLMMGSMLARAGEVLMISGRVDYRAHRQRIEGFRDVLQQRFPHLALREALAGLEDRTRISKLLEKALVASPAIVGVYNTGLGNSEISQALARHRRERDMVYITHELYATTRRLLQQRILTLTLDQNTLRHAQLALNLLLQKLEKGDDFSTYEDGRVDFMLYTQENVD
ncbi:LacI family DNA-binding transcriptional regulator [Pantoea septica]|uniref:LacI family DNA-binding transcriptional regulator n=1 Tax=Pantoea septica TaxID=472695 RepID=UPI003D02BAB6